MQSHVILTLGGYNLYVDHEIEAAFWATYSMTISDRVISVVVKIDTTAAKRFSLSAIPDTVERLNE